ncbi:MAG: universal stress protein [Pseudomonadota bacterium]
MIKKIAICVNETENRDNTIRVASRFANEHNADLLGVYILTNEPLIVPQFGAISVDMASVMYETQKRSAAEAKEAFLEITEPLGLKVSWVAVEDYRDAFRHYAYADLIITDQIDYDPTRSFSNAGLVNNMILDTGKPVVIIPADWDRTTFGQKLLLGWDESRESARALQDAMPLLKVAEHTDVVYVRSSAKSVDSDDGYAQIAPYLEQRNVKSTFHHAFLDKDNHTIGDVLLSKAHKKASDLIVIGAYGHTRLREIILGGVTRKIMRESKVPVLLAH